LASSPKYRTGRPCFFVALAYFMRSILRQNS
jgi:hypothetical protein